MSLYGKTSGAVLVNLGDVVVISQGSLYLALATFLRVAAIAVPGVILALGLDPTDLADGLVQILHLPSRFVYGGLAGVRLGSPVVLVDWATAAPSNVCSRRRSVCWSCRFDAARNSPPPWKLVVSARTLREARLGNRAYMPSIGCFT